MGAAPWTARRSRAAILASFVLVILAALPLWWKTTTIVRLPLPAHDVHRWEERGARVGVTLASEQLSLDHSVSRAIQEALQASATEDGLCMQWDVRAGEKAAQNQEATHTPSGTGVHYTLRIQPEGACDAGMFTVCTSDRSEAIVERVLAKLAPLVGRSRTWEPTPSSSALAAIQYAKDVRIVFSLLNEDAGQGGAASGWDLSDALQELDRLHGALPPRLAPLTPLFRLLQVAGAAHRFQLESQVQWYAPLEFTPHAETVHEAAAPTASAVPHDVPQDDTDVLHAAQAEEAEHAAAATYAESQTHPASHNRTEYFASLDNVRVFVNSVHWNLESYGIADAAHNTSVGGQFEEQTLHFVLFLPSAAHRPLRIRDPQTSEVIANPAWIVPQWGGVVVWNRTPSSDALSPALTLDELAEPLRLFALQLAQLLGVSCKDWEEDDSVLYFATQGLLWRRTLASAQNTVETLSSTVHLVNKIPNLGVGETVRSQFAKAIALLDTVRATLTQLDVQQRADPSWASALDIAFSAQTHASRAFFDPSMLAMLYFPDEHKYAVYTPLFGPLLVPLLVAMVRELKHRRLTRTAPEAD